MTKPDDRARADALVVDAPSGTRCIVFHFRRLVDYDVDGVNVYSERMGEAFARYGLGYDLIFDYTDFEPEILSERASQLYATSASALKALGHERYVRVVPPRLAAYFAPYERLVAAAGLDVVTVRSLDDAHAFYAARRRPRPVRDPFAPIPSACLSSANENARG